MKMYQYDILKYINMTLKRSEYDKFGSLCFLKLVGILSFLCEAIAILTSPPPPRNEKVIFLQVFLTALIFSLQSCLQGNRITYFMFVRTAPTTAWGPGSSGSCEFS